MWSPSILHPALGRSQERCHLKTLSLPRAAVDRANTGHRPRPPDALHERDLDEGEPPQISRGKRASFGKCTVHRGKTHVQEPVDKQGNANPRSYGERGICRQGYCDMGGGGRPPCWQCGKFYEARTVLSTMLTLRSILVSVYCLNIRRREWKPFSSMSPTR